MPLSFSAAVFIAIVAGGYVVYTSARDMPVFSQAAMQSGTETRIGSRLLSSLGMGIIAAALFALSGLGVETRQFYERWESS